MTAGFKLIGRLCRHPIQTVQEETFSNQPFVLWILAQLPMVAVLTVTGLIDPAPGQQADAKGFLFYLLGSILVCGFSMALGLAKSFLILWAGKKRLSLLGAAREMLPLNSLYILLEAAYTLGLFLLRYILPQGIYILLEQGCIFGLQLFYAIYVGILLYYREDNSLKRTIAVSLGCFWATSAWLMIGMFVR